MAKQIRFSSHANDQIAARGTSQAEISDVILTSYWQAAKQQGRWECNKEFPFNAIWNGNHYTTKKVRPIFVESAAEIVVITVYVYYHK